MNTDRKEMSATLRRVGEALRKAGVLLQGGKIVDGSVQVATAMAFIEGLCQGMEVVEDPRAPALSGPIPPPQWKVTGLRVGVTDPLKMWFIDTGAPGGYIRIDKELGVMLAGRELETGSSLPIWVSDGHPGKVPGG